MIKKATLFSLVLHFVVLFPCFSQDKNEIPYAEFSPDGKLLLTHDHLHYRLFDAVSGQFMYEIPTGFVKLDEPRPEAGGRIPIIIPIRNDAKFSPDSKVILLAYLNTIVIWEIASRKIVTRIKNCELESFNGDRSRFAGLSGSTTTIRETKTGKTIYKLKVSDNMRLSPDGTTLAISQSSPPDNKIRLIDISTGKDRKVLSTTHAYHMVTRFNPDGKLLLAAAQGDGEEDRVLLFWDPVTGNLVDSLPGKNFEPWFSEDGQKLVTLLGYASGGTTTDFTYGANVWDVATRKLLYTFTDEQDLTTARFSPNGNVLVTGSGNATAVVWDAANGTKRYTLEGHTGPVEVTAFDRQGKYVVTGSEDQTIKVWELESGKLVYTLTGQSVGR